MRVSVVIDRTAAILAGSDHYGLTILEINPGELTEVHRTLLATCTERQGITDELK